MRSLLLLGLIVLTLSSCDQEEEKTNQPFRPGQEAQEAELLSSEHLGWITEMCSALSEHRERIEDLSDHGRTFTFSRKKRECDQTVSPLSDIDLMIDIPFNPNEEAKWKGPATQEFLSEIFTDESYLVTKYCNDGLDENQWKENDTIYQMRVISSSRFEVGFFKQDSDDKWRVKRVESLGVYVNSAAPDNRGLNVEHQQARWCSNGNLSYLYQFINEEI